MATDLGKVGMVTKGAWSNTTAYEALDVVTYNNGLYISKQDVPAGTLPTNTNFWQVAITTASLAFVKRITVTGTTTNDGILGIPAAQIPGGYRVINAAVIGNYDSATISYTSNLYWLLIKQFNGNPRANTEVSVYVYLAITEDVT